MESMRPRLLQSPSVSYSFPLDGARVRFAGDTNIGRKRDHNEDSISLPENERLAIVAAATQLPPCSAAISTTMEPGRMRSTAPREMIFGAGRPGTAAVVTTASAAAIRANRGIGQSWQCCRRGLHVVQAVDGQPPDAQRLVTLIRGASGRCRTLLNCWP